MNYSLNTLKKRRGEIIGIAKNHGARNVRVFGSLARNEHDCESDVDLMVKMDRGRGLLDLASLAIELRNLLDCRVDVVSERGIKERIRERVLSEAVPL